MRGVEGEVSSGINFKVHTTSHRGWTPEELAERAMERFIAVSDTADPLIKAQALAFKDTVKNLFVFYMKEAIRSDRTTVCSKLNQQGHAELAGIISKL